MDDTVLKTPLQESSTDHRKKTIENCRDDWQVHRRDSGLRDGSDRHFDRSDFAGGSASHGIGSNASSKKDQRLEPFSNGWSLAEKNGVQPIPMDRIVAEMTRRTDDWPRRVGSALFVDRGEIIWLEKPSSLFAWTGSECGSVSWRVGTGFVTKSELFERLRQTTTAYRMVESMPHQPAIEGHYYRSYPDMMKCDGSRLGELLDRFKPLTKIDRDLIQAAFMTPGWGGRPGARPAYVLTSDDGRDSGKSTLAELIGYLWGGIISFSDREDVTLMKKRLMSSNTLQKRICLVDNIKSHKFSWADLEGLITSHIIDGYRNYVGDFERPNTLTWFLMLNGASLSKDMAQRSIVIKLARPKYSGTWAEETRRFIDKHRWEIVGDIIALLKQPFVAELPNFTRWGDWERDILQRLPDPLEAQRVILERQGEADVDAEEGGLLGQEFGQRLAWLGYDIDRDHVFIPASKVATPWYNEILNTKEKTQAVSRHLRQMIREGELPQLIENPRHGHGRGFIWQGPKADADALVLYDIEERMRRHTKN